DADHVERAVGEVDDARDTEDKRQACRDQEQRRRAGQAVKQLHDKTGNIHDDPLLRGDKAYKAGNPRRQRRPLSGRRQPPFQIQPARPEDQSSTLRNALTSSSLGNSSPPSMYSPVGIEPFLP